MIYTHVLFSYHEFKFACFFYFEKTTNADNVPGFKLWLQLSVISPYWTRELLEMTTIFIDTIGIQVRLIRILVIPIIIRLTKRAYSYTSERKQLPKMYNLAIVDRLSFFVFSKFRVHVPSQR